MKANGGGQNEKTDDKADGDDRSAMRNDTNGGNEENGDE